MTPLRTPEVAALLGVSEATVARAVRANQIPHYRVGRCIRFVRSTVESWMGVQSQNAIPRDAEGEMPPQPRRHEKLVGRMVRERDAPKTQVDSPGRLPRGYEAGSAPTPARRPRRRGPDLDYLDSRTIRPRGLAAPASEALAVQHPEEH